VRLFELSYRDLSRLRMVVRRVHMQHYPIDHCTDRECDRIIETLLPATAERLLKRLVDGRSLDEKDL
jgi:hypothetical protein